MDEDLYITYSTSFRGMRVFDRFIHPTEWTLRAEVFLDPEVTNLDVNTTFSVLNYFFTEIVSDSVFFASTNRWAAKSLRKCHNNVVLTPSDPADNQLAPLFQAKMNALASQTVRFSTVELDSNSGVGLSFVFAGDAAAYLPELKDWVGEGAYFAEEPWWNRADGSTMDMPASPGKDPTMVPDFVHDLSFLADQFIGMAEPAKVIRPEPFRPKIIRGSLDDKKD